MSQVSYSCPNISRTCQLTSLSSEKNHRFTHVLDSIANISISQAQSEVVAVAVQQTKTDIKLVVASNNNLPASTIEHLKKVWNMLKHLCQDYLDYTAAPDNIISSRRPSTKDLSKSAQIRVKTLRRMILQFNHQKLRRRLSKHYKSFVSVKRTVAKELGLEPMITDLQELMPALDLDALPDDAWCRVWRVLENVRLRFEVLSDTIKKHENTPRIPFPLFRFLSKVISVIKDIKVLMKAANSPRLRVLFNRNFQIIDLKGSGNEPFDLPNSPAGWNQLVENTLQWRNMIAKTKGEVKLELDEINVQQHIVKMCEAPPRKTNHVHCELKIVGHILQSSEEGFLNYIGVSKLCCRGCSQCIQAVNNILLKGFKTKGTHQKFYYPWRFPNLPQANTVAEQMRNSISFVFGQTYKGFCPETQPYLSDSEATTSSSTQGGSDSEDDHPLNNAYGLLRAAISERAKTDDRRKREWKSQN